jgi:hypothetical protein
MDTTAYAASIEDSSRHGYWTLHKTCAKGVPGMVDFIYRLPDLPGSCDNPNCPL